MKKYIFLFLYLYHLYNLQSAEEHYSSQTSHHSQSELTGMIVVACASKHKLTRVAIKQSPSPHYPWCHRPSVWWHDSYVLYKAAAPSPARHTWHVTPGHGAARALTLSRAKHCSSVCSAHAAPPHMLEGRSIVLETELYCNLMPSSGRAAVHFTLPLIQKKINQTYLTHKKIISTREELAIPILYISSLKCLKSVALFHN